ncbi:MAG: hypothetical protein J6Q67_06105 [Clostridia bacterium]|jgi:hypothetical protein|nr:hypothetical protein [Clostridia bacterium]
MAKGALAKADVTKKILSMFDNAFEYGKEIRVPMIENGEQVQIKVTLTCAKENVECGADTALPGEFPTPVNAAPTPVNTAPVQPTAEEKQNVANLLRSLGL